MRQAVLGVLFWSVVGTVSAGDSVVYAIVPVDPRAGDLIRFRMDVIGCFNADVFVHVRSSERVVDVEVHSPDFCDPGDPGSVTTPRFHDIGKLPAGPHTIRIFDCGGPVPPPLPACVLSDEVAIVVMADASARPRAVPTLSSLTTALLLAIMAAVAGLRLRLERER